MLAGVETKLMGEIGGVETRLIDEIRAVRAASDTAHKEIIERLERLEQNQR